MTARLCFAYEFDERAAYEAEARGYVSHVAVQDDAGRFYPVVFYDPVRLSQDLEEEAEYGRAYLAEPGLIVVPQTTPELMVAAVRRLLAESFFEALRPLDEFAFVTDFPL